jgi:hypothetical protein
MLKVVDVIGLASTGAYDGDASLVTRMKIVRIARLGSDRLPQNGPCRHRPQHMDLPPPTARVGHPGHHGPDSGEAGANDLLILEQLERPLPASWEEQRNYLSM